MFIKVTTVNGCRTLIINTDLITKIVRTPQGKLCVYHGTSSEEVDKEYEAQLFKILGVSI